MPVPFGEFDIYNESHFLEALAQSIVEHLDIQRWVFKIDDDFDGLGIAYCDIAAHLPSYRAALKEAARFRENWSQRWAHVSESFAEQHSIAGRIEPHSRRKCP